MRNRGWEEEVKKNCTFSLTTSFQPRTSPEDKSEQNINNFCVRFVSFKRNKWLANVVL